MPTVRKVDPPAPLVTKVRRPRIKQPAPEVIRLLFGGLKDRSGISRTDNDDTHGWYVRVYPPGAGKKSIGKLFSDGQHGGPSMALAEAVRWRARERAKLPPRAQPQPRVWRVDNTRQHGHVAKNRVGERRYFSDTVYGGAAGSETAARTWAGK
jgi:hypothetical protein